MATPETEGMRYARLAREECIERKGDCAGCINALETFEGKCMIRWTQREVIDALGFSTEPTPQAVEDEFDTYICHNCGGEYEASTKAGAHRYCQPCRVEINRKRSQAKSDREKQKRKTAPAVVLDCPACKVTFTQDHPHAKFCKGCRSNGFRLCACIRCAGLFASRGHSTKFCQGCQDTLIAEGGLIGQKILAGRTPKKESA